jgi:hypothetical protein
VAEGTLAMEHLPPSSTRAPTAPVRVQGQDNGISPAQGQDCCAQSYRRAIAGKSPTLVTIDVETVRTLFGFHCQGNRESRNRRCQYAVAIEQTRRELGDLRGGSISPRADDRRIRLWQVGQPP